MAINLLRSLQIVKKSPSLNLAAFRFSHVASTNYESELQKIGNREVVGPGINNQPNYFDQGDFPCPAIRFKTVTPAIQVWKLLNFENKSLFICT